MSFQVQCPGCNQLYALPEEMIGRRVRCKECEREFQVSVPTAPVASPAPQKSAMEDLLDEAFGDPSSGSDSAGPSPFGAGAPLASRRPRRRRTNAGEIVFLVLGVIFSVLALGALFVVIPLLGISSVLATMAVFFLGILGGGSLVLGLRSNLPVALSAGGGVGFLLFLGMIFGMVVGTVVQPLARTPEEATDNLVGQMGQMAQLAESIQDEASLKEVQAKIVRLYSRMLGTSARLEQLDATGQHGQAIEDAVLQFHRRMTEVAVRLPQVPGGAELGRRLAWLTAKASVPAPWAKPKEPKLSDEKRDLLKRTGQAYHGYCDANRSPPPDWESFVSFLRNTSGDLAAIEQLRSEGLVVQWGVSFARATIGTSNFVLAYEKRATERGGGVLMMDGSVRVADPHELREMLNTQVAVVEKATGVAPPKWPELGVALEETPPDITTWIPSGWIIPPPPESPENRKLRKMAREEEERSEDLVIVYVDGVTSKSVISAVMRKLGEAQWGYGSVGGPPKPGNPSGFSVAKVQDIRDFASALDIGPIILFDEAKGVIRLRLDPAKLVDRPEAPVAGALSGAKSVDIPRPPEPDEIRRKRETTREKAGVPAGELEVTVEGVADAEAAKEVASALSRDTVSKGVGWTPASSSSYKYNFRGVEDMRVFASQINLGPIRKYDERRGVIVVWLDPTKMAESIAAAVPKPVDLPAPPEPAENRAKRQAARRAEPGRRIGPKFIRPHEDSVEVRVDGASEETADAITKWIEALTGQFVGTSHSGHRWMFRPHEVEDIRVFASRLNLGPIMRYEEEKGIIEVKLDPSKLSQPLPETIASSSPPATAEETPGAASPGDGSQFPRSGFGSLPLDPRRGPRGNAPFGAGGRPSLPPGQHAPGQIGGGMAPPGSIRPGSRTAPDVGKKGELLGGSGGRPFHEARAGQHVTELRWVSGNWAGKQALGRLLPDYGPRRAKPSRQSLQAREGYVVGGLIVDAGDLVFAVKAVFVRLNPDGSVNSDDTYTSDWIGHPSGDSPQTLDAKGAKVIGIHGRGAAVIDAIGLVTE